MFKLVRHFKVSKEFVVISNYEIHSLYCEKNLTECPYCRTKMSRKDLDLHVSEEKGEARDLIEAVSKGRMESILTMFEHGNDIYLKDDLSNTLLHYAARNL